MRTEKALTEKARNRKAVSIMRRISSRSPRPRVWGRALGGVVSVAALALLLSTPPQAAAQSTAQAQASASVQAGSPAELNDLIGLAQKGIGELVGLQRMALNGEAVA